MATATMLPSSAYSAKNPPGPGQRQTLNCGFDDPEQDEPLVGVNTWPAVAPVTVAPSSKAARIDLMWRLTHRRDRSLS
jgi:hypothetical protein